MFIINCSNAVAVTLSLNIVFATAAAVICIIGAM